MRYSLQNNPPRQKDGFTLVEMLVVAPILILMIGGLIAAIVTLTGEALVARAQNQLIYDINDALGMIENDARLSTGFLATTSVQSPQGYDNNTADFNNVDVSKGDMLILSVPLTTTNPSSVDRKLVYLADAPSACGNPDVVNNTIMTGKIVYFVRDNTLWRRTILPTGYANAGFSCSTPWQVPSCAATATRGTYCKTNDIRLVHGVTASDFSVKYFSSPGATTADSTASDTSSSATVRQTSLDTISTIEVKLTSTQTPAGRDISHTASVRASKIN